MPTTKAGSGGHFIMEAPDRLSPLLPMKGREVLHPCLTRDSNPVIWCSSRLPYPLHQLVGVRKVVKSSRTMIVRAAIVQNEHVIMYFDRNYFNFFHKSKLHGWITLTPTLIIFDEISYNCGPSIKNVKFYCIYSMYKNI